MLCSSAWVAQSYTRRVQTGSLIGSLVVLATLLACDRTTNTGPRARAPEAEVPEAPAPTFVEESAVTPEQLEEAYATLRGEFLMCEDAEAIETILGHTPDDLLARYAQARCLRERGQATRAVAVLKELLTDLAAEFEAGRASPSLSEDSESFVTFEELAHEELGWAALEAGDLPLAERELVPISERRCLDGHPFGEPRCEFAQDDAKRALDHHADLRGVWSSLDPELSLSNALLEPDEGAEYLRQELVSTGCRDDLPCVVEIGNWDDAVLLIIPRGSQGYWVHDLGATRIKSGAAEVAVTAELERFSDRHLARVRITTVHAEVDHPRCDPYAWLCAASAPPGHTADPWQREIAELWVDYVSGEVVTRSWGRQRWRLCADTSAWADEELEITGAPTLRGCGEVRALPDLGG